MNVSLTQLWMPILAGGALAWIGSALIHMLLKYHNSDYRKLANEDDVAAAIRNGQPEVGFYSFPHCIDMNEMKDDSIAKKFADGPVGFVTVLPDGMPKMGKLLGQQIAFYVGACFLIAYTASLVLTPGADYMTVFRLVSSVGFLTFGWAIIPFSIWYGHPWSTTGKYLLDALIYALIVAGTFAWLWPAAG